MNNTKRILQYLLIVVGIIVPIYLGNVLKMNTASDSGVALKDIPAEAVTCTGAAQGMNGPVTVEVVATKDRIYSVKVVDQKETEGIGTVAAVEIPAKIFEKQSVQVDSMTGATLTSNAIKQGVVLAPEDRKKDGLCTKLSIRQNIALPNLDVIAGKSGVINRKVENELCDKAVEELSIKTPNLEVDTATLSGGNQQKVVVAKWLARNSRVVIFDEPTRGIDVGAKVEIYHLMNQLKKQGIAVMFVSSEMPEVMGIADRIIVMCDGRITGELQSGEATQEEILRLATSFENKMSAAG